MNIGPGFLNQVPTEANEVKLESMGKTVKSKCKTLITVTPVVPYEQTPLIIKPKKIAKEPMKTWKKTRGAFIRSSKPSAPLSTPTTRPQPALPLICRAIEGFSRVSLRWSCRDSVFRVLGLQSLGFCWALGFRLLGFVVLIALGL